jgi:hypothetical protein
MIGGEAGQNVMLVQALGVALAAVHEFVELVPAAAAGLRRCEAELSVAGLHIGFDFHFSTPWIRF